MILPLGQLGCAKGGGGPHSCVVHAGGGLHEHVEHPLASSWNPYAQKTSPHAMVGHPPVPACPPVPAVPVPPPLPVLPAAPVLPAPPVTPAVPDEPAWPVVPVPAVPWPATPVL